MTVLRNERCEFCMEDKKYVSSNSFHGFFCLECLRLSRAEDIGCVKEIEKQKRLDKAGEGGAE